MDTLDLFETTEAGKQPPKTPPAPPAAEDAGDFLPLGDYAERAYLQYAMSVVKGRALPDVADGLKPVQRRILFAMRELGLGASAKPVKSARVVGEVLGKLHPHGDASAYDAMVRMAQDFSLRYPLIDGHGNFGSRDGDGAAAMRYTEARLSAFAELLLAEIDQGTVDFVSNYDNTLEEPQVLPARLPVLLLNGASGIAVGMATEVPPHNLVEVAEAAVALIQNPQLDVHGLLQIIPGPDFPGGGQIISSPETIRDIYSSGRGSLRVRARWHIEKLARGQWQAVIHELPPQTSSQKVLEEIEELSNPRVRAGRKELSAEQRQSRQAILSVLDAVRDESGREHAVRLVFEPKSSRQDPEEFMQLLLSLTSMEGNAPMNLVSIGLDGRPAQKNLKEILAEWIAFRFQTVTRRTRHRLEKVEARIHILEGRMIAFLNIDEVIRVIREADDPKADLIVHFALSETQAEDILEIRLRQLARLEGIKIERELGELRDERGTLLELLDDAGKMRRLIIKEIRKDAQRFGDARRTLIEQAMTASAKPGAVLDEPVTIILSRKGWIRSRTGHGLDAGGFSFKEGDALLAAAELRSTESVVLMDDQGRAYTLPAASVPGGRGEGVPVATLLELPKGARIQFMLSSGPEQRWLLASSDGYGFLAGSADLQSRVRGGKAVVNLSEGAALLPPIAVAEQDELVLRSASGRLLIYPASEIRSMARGRGVQLMALAAGDQLAEVQILGDSLTVSGKRKPQQLGKAQLAPLRGRRGGRGKIPGEGR